MSKPTIVILSGSGGPAVAAANIYFERLSAHFRVLLVEERNLTGRRILQTLRRRWRASGLAGVLDLLALRVLLMLTSSPVVERRYRPTLFCDDVNSPEVQALLEAHAPAWVVTNACSVVQAKLLQAVPAPFINVHNGITPRYRGTGNFWAAREGNPGLLGVTVHRVDKGIDTGERLGVSRLGSRDPRCSTLAAMDVAAFEDGAEMVCRHLLGETLQIPAEFTVLPNRYYSFPGLTDWLIARRNLKRWQAARPAGEAFWRASFAGLAHDESKGRFQRMHWGQEDSVSARDSLVQGLLRGRLTPGSALLDLGGGDGRMAQALPELGLYVCADFTHAFLTGLPEHCRYPAWAVQCDARALPFRHDQFDAAIAVGLFQHLTEAQRVADELRACVRADGVLIVNTLRQFSRFELLLIMMGSVFSPTQLRLALAIWKEDYYSGRHVDQTPVARRYRLSELRAMFGVAKIGSAAYFDGVWSTRLFAREITLVMPCRH